MIVTHCMHNCISLLREGKYDRAGWSAGCEEETVRFGRKAEYTSCGTGYTDQGFKCNYVYWNSIT